MSKSFMELAARRLGGLKKYASVGVVSTALMSGVVFAQTDGGGTLDTSAVTADIAEGVAAIAVVGAAWVGFKYLKKVWNKI